MINPKNLDDLIRRQRELLDLDNIELPDAVDKFSPARFHAVTTGQDRWRPEEEQLIASNPSLQRYALLWQEAAAAVNPDDRNGVNWKSDDDAKNYILRFEPSLSDVFALDGLRLLSTAAGDEDLPEDLSVAEDIYGTKLGVDPIEFGFGCLGDDWKDVFLHDLSAGEDTIATGTVSLDRSNRRVKINTAEFPDSDWRLYYIGPSNPHRSRTGNRAVFAIGKGNSPARTDKASPCQLILQGRLVDSLVATSLEKLDRRRLICRRWVLVARMELLLKREAIPALKLKSNDYEFLLSELREIAERKLDLIKQSLIEML